MASRDLAFHGEFSSADASALSEVNSRVLLYPAGTVTAYTLAATDQVLIYRVTLVCGAALTVQLYDGADNSVGAGEKVLQGNFAANGGVGGPFAVAHQCQAGTWPKVKTNTSGQIDVTIHGVIRRP